MSRQIAGRTARTGPAGVPAFLFGLLFLGGGYHILFHASNWLSRAFSPSKLVIVCVGSFLAVLGLASVAQAGRGLAVRWRLRRRRREHPEEPWLWSPFWSATGARLGLGRRLTTLLLTTSLFTLILVPFHPSTHWLLLFGDAVALAFWGVTIYQLIQGTKYGESELRFAKNPFFLGEEVEVHLQGGDRLRGYTEMTWTLRCIEERLVGTPKNRSVACFALYEDKRVVAPGEVDLGPGKAARFFQLGRQKDESSELHMLFPLPDKRDLATSQDPPRYWELEIKARVPGIDYKAAFFLPVYARSEA
jgi:hypothetical protein